MLFNNTGTVDGKGAPKNQLYINISGTVSKFMEVEKLKPRIKIDIKSLQEVDTLLKIDL